MPPGSRSFPPLRLEAPLPRSRVWSSGRIPRQRTLLAAVAALLLAAAVVGIAVAMGRHGTNTSTDTSAAGETGSNPTARGHDPDTIVPGTSIGAVKLGMTKSDVEKLYGHSAETQWRSRGRTGPVLVFSRTGGVLSVSFYDGKVVQITTTDPRYATADGLRIGVVAPYPGALKERMDAALRTGELVKLGPGLYAWRSFIYENVSYCLRGNRAVTQLTLNISLTHVISILVTDIHFLADLPARVSQQGEGVVPLTASCAQTPTS
jgi:hypothetical protein